MNPLTIAQRVAVLQQELSELKAQRRQEHVNDWRRTVGIFTDNPGMNELLAKAMKLREADRRKARRRQSRNRPVAPSGNGAPVRYTSGSSARNWSSRSSGGTVRGLAKVCSD